MHKVKAAVLVALWIASAGMAPPTPLASARVEASLVLARAEVAKRDVGAASAILLSEWAKSKTDTSVPITLRLRLADALVSRLCDLQRFPDAETVATEAMPLLENAASTDAESRVAVEARAIFAVPLIRLGKLREAEAELKQAEQARLLIAGDTRAIQVVIAQRMAVVLSSQGRLDEATELMAPLVPVVLAADYPDPARGMVIPQTLAGLLMYQSRYPEALATLTAMRSPAMALWASSPRQQAEFLELVGEAYRANDRNTDARDTYFEALALFGKAGQIGSVTEATLHSNLARSLRLLGDAEGSAFHANRGVELLEARLAAARKAGKPLSALDMNFLPPVVAADLDSKYMLRAKLHGDALKTADAASFRRMQMAFALAQTATSATAALDQEQPVALSAIQTSLHPTEALMLVVEGTDATHVVGVTRNGFAWHRHPQGSNEMCPRIAALRAGLVPGQPLRCVDGGGNATVTAGGFDAAGSYGLYKDLFEPLARQTRAKPYWIVAMAGSPTALPVGVLATAPPAGRDYAGVQWLARERALSYLPSAASFVALRSAAHAPPAIASFTGFGAPCVGSNAGAACRSDAPTTASVSEGLASLPADFRLGVLRNSGGFAGDVAAVRELPALPRARIELAALAASFPGHAKFAVGENATRAAVQSGVYPPGTVVAFATHGLAAGEFGLPEPALVLTPGPALADGDDGLLLASDVAKLALPQAFVVLSACNMGGIRSIDRLDPFQGFARAFFAAGATSMLISQFEVADDSAMRLTTGTLAAWRQNPQLGRAEALRKSVDAMLKNASMPQLHNPRAWGSMVLVGTPD